MVSTRGMKARAAAAEAANPSEHGEVVHPIKKLEELQKDLARVDEEVNQKMLEVKQEFDEMREGFYIVRNDIVKSISDFWLTVFMNHPKLGNLLNEEDQKIFEYLDRLYVKNFKDTMKGYGIIFGFKANPYFENTKLTKVFKFSDGGTLMSTGTTIKWKEGKGPAECSDAGEQGNKRPRPLESFFSWFSHPSGDATVSVEQDEVAELIKEDLWPNAIVYFNNEDDEDSDEDEDDENEEAEEHFDQETEEKGGSGEDV